MDKVIRFCGLEFEVNLSFSAKRVKRITVPIHSRGENEYVYHKCFEDGSVDVHINYVLHGKWRRIDLPYKCRRAVTVSIDPMYYPNTDNRGINDHRTMVIDLYK